MYVCICACYELLNPTLQMDYNFIHLAAHWQELACHNREYRSSIMYAHIHIIILCTHVHACICIHLCVGYRVTQLKQYNSYMLHTYHVHWWKMRRMHCIMHHTIMKFIVNIQWRLNNCNNITQHALIVLYCRTPWTISSLWMRCVALLTNIIRAFRLVDHSLRTSPASFVCLNVITPAGLSIRAYMVFFNTRLDRNSSVSCVKRETIALGLIQPRD